MSAQRPALWRRVLERHLKSDTPCLGRKLAADRESADPVYDDLQPTAAVACDLRSLETSPEYDPKSGLGIGASIEVSENRVDLAVFPGELDTVTALGEMRSACAHYAYRIADRSREHQRPGGDAAAHGRLRCPVVEARTAGSVPGPPSGRFRVSPCRGEVL